MEGKAINSLWFWVNNYKPHVRVWRIWVQMKKKNKVWRETCKGVSAQM